MSKIFIDTEFNGFNGQLISMALVGPNNSEWYEVLPLPDKIDPWVAINVVPFLCKAPIREGEFKASLISYLQMNVGIPIIADWPEDLIHLMRYTYSVNGEQLSLEYKTELVISGALDSKVPHNALSDARALKKWYQNDRSA